MVLKTFLIFVVALIGYSDSFTGTSLIQRPIVMGTLTGLALGDLKAGIIMGGTIELAMVGAVSIGAYIPPDMVSGTILGVSLAIEAHANPAAALTLGIPIATIVLALNTAIGQPIKLIFVHRIDKNAKEADTRAIGRNMILGGYVGSLPGLIITPVAFYFGQHAVTSLLDNIPTFISTGMSIAAGLLPALGFAMLAQMIMTKKVAVFFFIGFFLVAYGKISTTGVAIFAAMIIIVMYLFVETKNIRSEERDTKNNTEDDTEGKNAQSKEDGFDEF